MSIFGTCGMHCLRQQPTSQNQQDKKGEGGAKGKSSQPVNGSSKSRQPVIPNFPQNGPGASGADRSTVTQKVFTFFPWDSSCTYVHVVTRGSDPPGWRECCKLLPGAQWQKSVILLLLLCPAKPVLCCLNNTGRSTLGPFPEGPSGVRHFLACLRLPSRLIFPALPACEAAAGVWIGN